MPRKKKIREEQDNRRRKQGLESKQNEDEVASDAEFTSGSDSDNNGTGRTNLPEGLPESRREADRERLRNYRANMTPEQKEAARERGRIQKRERRERLKKAEQDGQKRNSDSGSSESSGQSSDEGGSQDEQEEKLKRRRAVDRKRKQIARTNFQDDDLERRREIGRLRTQAKRANMSPEEKEAQRLKSRLQARERRAKLRTQEGHELRLQKAAEAARLRRKLNAEKPYSAEAVPDSSDVIPGETCGERRRRLQREHRAENRRQRGLAPVENVVKDKAQDRIIGRIDRTLFTSEEKKIREELKDWRKIKLYGAPTPLEPQIEDDWAWKDLFFYEMKFEFQKERNILVEEALEIELGPTVPGKQSPLQDPDWVLNLGNKLSSRQRRRHHSGTTAHDRWQGTETNQENDHEEDDDETDAVLNAFNQVEIKIEAEDNDEPWDADGGLGLDDEDGEDPNQQRNCEDDVADWIARVITGEQAQNQDDSATTGSSSSSREKHSILAKSQAVQRFQDIISASQESSHAGGPASNRRETLGRWRNFAIKRVQDEKMDDLRKNFLNARQRWNKTLEDIQIRIKVDQERTALRETVRAKKRAGLETVIKELIHKRDFFSHEAPETRNSRIEELYAVVASDLVQVREIREKLGKMTKEEIEEKRKEKRRITTPLSKEELRKITTANSALRLRMERGEYEQHIDLLFATGFPIPPPKYGKIEVERREKMMAGLAVGTCSVSHFEDAFKSELYIKSMTYFIGAKVARLRTEVTTYRRLLWELLAKRRHRKDSSSNISVPSSSTAADQTSEDYEWIQIPESSSLEDMDRFKEFISKYGEPVLEHVTFKRFYAGEKMKCYGRGKIGAVSPEKREVFRLKQNEYLRRRYIEKKYGITLGPGEYFDKKTMSSVKKAPKSYLAWARKAAMEDGDEEFLALERSRMEAEAAAGLEPRPSVPKPKKRIRKRNPNPHRKRGPAKLPRNQNPKKKKSFTSTGGGVNQFSPHIRYSGDGGHGSYASTSRTTTSCRIDVDYSNSGDGVGHQDDDSNDGWVPLGSYEIDSVIRQDILNIPSGGHAQQPHQNFNLSTYHALQQQQQFSSAQTNHHHVRSGNSQHQQHQNYQQFTHQSNQSHNSHSSPLQLPQLQLVDQFTGAQMNVSQYNNATGQWSTNTGTQPLNYSLQFLPNSQISVIPNQQLSSHLASSSQGYGWTSSSNLTHLTNLNQSNNYSRNDSFHHQHHQIDYDGTTPSSSIAGDAISLADSDYVASGSTSPFSPPKSRGGRPKGSKNRPQSAQSSLQKALKTISRKRNSRTHPPPLGTPKRDIWNNLKRRKYHETGPPTVFPVLRPVASKIPPIESPFERNPRETRDSALAENISLLLPKCPQCDAVFDDDGALMRHMKAAHQQPPPEIQVPPPPATTTTPTSTTPAVAKARNRVGLWRNPKERLPCSICPVEVEGPSALIEHWCLSHFEVRPFKCPFGSNAPSQRWTTGRCVSFRFERNNLLGHIQRKHPEEGKTTWIMGVHRPQTMVGKTRFCCIHCESFYSTYSELKEHCKGTHDKVKYCCVHCGIYLRTEDFWLDHVKLFHPEKPERSVPIPTEVDSEDVFRCAECDSEFSAQSFMNDHVAQGHTLLQGVSSQMKKSFLCPTCDKPFNSEGQRDDHFRKYCKDTKYECFWCKSKLLSEDELAKHLEDAHPHEPPVPEHLDGIDRRYSHDQYKCEICRKSFMNLYSLRLHCMNSHELYKYLQSVKDKYPPPQPQLEQPAETTPKTSPKEKAVLLPGAKDTKIPQTTVAAPIPSTSTDSSHYGYMDVLPPNVTLISCPVCKTTGHNLHQTHKAYDKLMRRYCFPCERLFSRSTVMRQHNEAAHGMAPDAIMTYPAQCGRPGKIADLNPPNPEDWLECSCAWSFTKEEFHHHHLFFEKDPDIRVCHICSRKFFTHPNYLNHMHSDHGVPKNLKMVVYKKPIPPPELVPKRELCEEDYEKLSSATTMSSATGEVTIFSCRVCLKNFKTLDFLRTHIEGNHKEDAFTRVMCKICNTTFANKHNLAKHDRHHHGAGLVRFLCPVCQVPISRKDHLKVHFHKFHPNDKYDVNEIKTVPMEVALETTNKLSCKICSATFATETGLKSHMTNKHFPTHWSTFCEFCGLQMNSKAMKPHILKEHPKGNEDLYANKRKDRLGLVEIVELIQALYDKAGNKDSEIGITSEGRKRTRRKDKKKSATKAKIGGSVTRRTSKSGNKKQRKPRDQEPSSSESDEEDEGEQDDFATGYLSSESGGNDNDAESSRNIYDLYDEVNAEMEESENEDEETNPKQSYEDDSFIKPPRSSRERINAKPKSKTAPTKSAPKPRKSRRKSDSNSDDEEFVRKMTSSGTRSRPARNKVLDDNSDADTKTVKILLEKCTDVGASVPPNSSRKQNRKLSKSSTNNTKPRPKSKQSKNQSSLPPTIKTEVLDDLDLDYLIKDEVEDVEEYVEDNEDMMGVMEHNLDTLQWEYVQLPVSAELEEMEEEDQDVDLPVFDPLSL